MSNQPKVINTNFSYKTLRLFIGILGLLLPLLLPMFNGWEMRSSISKFYYSNSSIFFTSILFALGLFLFTYRGREKEKGKLSDNLITNFGGLFAMLTALVPTKYYKEVVELLNYCVSNEYSIQYVHKSEYIAWVHTGSAILFLLIVGYMSYFRFTLGNQRKTRKLFYRICGLGVWISCVLTGLDMYFEWAFTTFDVFIGESIALYFFGAAWLVKSGIFDKGKNSHYNFSPK